MNLYLSKGRIWTGTQADAREAQGDKAFEHVDVPTDKPTLIAWLNRHWAAFTDGMRIVEPAPVQPVAEPVAEIEPDKAAPAPRKGRFHDDLKHIAMEHNGTGYCARCHRSTGTVALHSRQFALGLIEQASADELRVFEQAMTMRREALAYDRGDTVAVPAARVRQRVRVQPVATEVTQ